jgi:hypothetical protein
VQEPAAQRFEAMNRMASIAKYIFFMSLTSCYGGAPMAPPWLKS